MATLGGRLPAARSFTANKETAMLLPVLLVAGVLTVPINHGAPRAADACFLIDNGKPLWFERVGKATVGCPRDFTMPVGWDRRQRLVLPAMSVSPRLQPE